MMEEWLVVTSKSGKHVKYGYPIGEILCQDPENVQKVIKEMNIHDPVITKYCELKE